MGFKSFKNSEHALSLQKLLTSVYSSLGSVESLTPLQDEVSPNLIDRPLCHRS
jgi:hypothetical protein